MVVETSTPLETTVSAQRWREAFLGEAAAYRVRARVISALPIPGARGHVLCALRVGGHTFPRLYCPAPPAGLTRGQRVEAVLYVAASACTFPAVPEPFIRAPAEAPERFTAAGRVVAALSAGRFVVDAGLPLVVAVYDSAQAKQVAVGDWLEFTAVPPTHAYVLAAEPPSKPS